MKTREELEKEILSITLKIHKEFPELIKYIAEMPEGISNKNTDNIDIKYFKEYLNALEKVVFEYAKTHAPHRVKNHSEEQVFPGYASYPPSDDLYIKGKEEMDINPEDLRKKKTPNEKEGSMNEKEFNEDMTGGDLDVPGAELDDQAEEIGNEDEENNYYSIGDDDDNDSEKK